MKRIADGPTRPGILADLWPSGRPFDMLAYGDPNIDLVFRVQRPPASDEKVLGRLIGRFAGGTVANAACAAGSMGCRVQAFGRVGDDPDGRFLLAEYGRFSVDTDNVRTLEDRASATALIMLEDRGEKALVYSPMDGALFEPERLAPALAASALLYAMPYDLAEFDTVHAMARRSGTLVAIDVEAAMVVGPTDMDRLLGMADVVFMNDTSYRTIFGKPARLVDMRALLAKGPRALVVTCGAAGALAVTTRDEGSYPAFPARLVDSTGAGDCFNGAFLVALSEARGLTACLRFACAAASVAVSRFGARSGIPERSLVDELLARASSDAEASPQIGETKQ